MQYWMRLQPLRPRIEGWRLARGLHMTLDIRQTDQSKAPEFISRGASARAAYLHADAAGQSRLQRLACASSTTRRLVDDLLAVAIRGLPQMHKAGVFGHTLRSTKAAGNWVERLEGENLRYAAMVALGLSKTPESTQRQVLGFGTAADLAELVSKRAEAAIDDGAVALAAWAAAEAGHFHAAPLFRRLAERLSSTVPMPTVVCAWVLIAALAARRFGNMWDVAAPAHKRLLAANGDSGLFRSIDPASAGGRIRAHIGCFADQVYPIMALSRLGAAIGDPDAMKMAETCARLICEAQGSAGQWWWHYDTRTGRVAEGFPVYSVHQHAMAPMALFELREAGGSDYLPEIAKGLDWLGERPETTAALICADKGVIWRKVGRHEPGKAARAIAAMAATISPTLHVRGLDIIFPPGRIDYECRPYELGWLLYAWLSAGIARRGNSHGVEHAEAVE
jgi:hypothetical protein